MGVTCYCLVANAADAKAVAAHDDPSKKWDGFYFKGLDRIKLSALWALVEGGSVEDRFEQRVAAIQTIPENDEGPWVDTTPSEMVAALAPLAAMEDEEVAALATELSKMEDFEGWDQSEVIDLIRSVGDQAEMASIGGKTLLLYTPL